MREMDLIMGGFADQVLAELTEAELNEFECLMDYPDRMVLAWITGEAAVPSEHDGPVLRRLRDFRLSGAA
jgi:antitoxin CptB